MKAVIFDKDGVLLNSGETNILSVIGAFKELGISITEEEKEYVIGKHPRDYREYFLERYNIDYNKFSVIQSIKYYEHLEKVTPRKKAISLVHELKKLNINIALTTSSSLNSTLKTLKKIKLSTIFDVIITRDDVKNSKPHPESYLLTAKKLNIKPEDCVVIEDSDVGVESAKSAGMKCIAIPNEYTKNMDLSKADLIIRSQEEINMKIFDKF
ncbi:MAG: HAD family phosphatase [Nanoarchaeota archaeon]|nr:HAD family phosphatase [Nanoarchaeota archaeon]